MSLLFEVCQYLHNWFEPQDGAEMTGRFIGRCSIDGGKLYCDGEEIVPKNGQYFRLIGSMQDDVYKYPAILADEEWSGAVWLMNPPAGVLAILQEMQDWQAKHADALTGPYQSESFGGYTYSLKSGTSASGQADNSAGSWQGVFKSRLNEWRKLA